MEKGWKEIFLTLHQYKAEIAKDLLESAEIKVIILNQHDTAIQSHGDFCLYVAEENAERAVEILKKLKN